jgi:hypothetical protein
MTWLEVRAICVSVFTVSLHAKNAIPVLER